MHACMRRGTIVSLLLAACAGDGLPTEAVLALGARPTVVRVTSLADDHEATCSAVDGTLRWAIACANATRGRQDLYFDVEGTIVLDGEELRISDDIHIFGPGADRLTISGDGRSRVFRVVGAKADLRDLTVTGGLAVVDDEDPNPYDDDLSAMGGGVLVAGGTLEMKDAVVTANHVQGDGAGGYGGGIGVVDGTLALDRVEVTGNSITASHRALGGAVGALHSQLAVEHTTLRGNTNHGCVAAGGALVAGGGSATLKDVVLADNEVYGAPSAGGSCTNPFPEGPYGFGAALFAVLDATVRIERGELTGNVTRSHAYGTQAATSPGGAIFANGLSLEILASNISSNQIVAEGGGPVLAAGAAVFAGGGTTVISDTSMTGNLAWASGTSGAPNVFAIGGALGVDGLASLTVQRGSVAGNLAYATSPIGIAVGGAAWVSAALTLQDTEVTDNTASATVFGGGGGFWTEPDGSLTITCADVHDNVPTDFDGPGPRTCTD